MVDIEVGRGMMYFSVENRAKIGVGKLGYAKYSFWSQNNVILPIITFLNSKRRCFGLSRTKTSSFLPVFSGSSSAQQSELGSVGVCLLVVTLSSPVLPQVS